MEEVIRGDLVITNRLKKQLLEELARRGFRITGAVRSGVLQVAGE